jgi:hypothetical protein
MRRKYKKFNSIIEGLLMALRFFGKYGENHLKKVNFGS